MSVLRHAFTNPFKLHEDSERIALIRAHNRRLGLSTLRWTSVWRRDGPLIASSRKGRVLRTISIVEDDQAVRHSLRAPLETHRLQGTDFPSPDALLPHAPRSAFDLFRVYLPVPR